MTINTPLRNCFQKFCFDTQSSMTNTRDSSLLLTAATASPIVRPRSFVTLYIIRSNAVNRQAVCNESVHTNVLMPP